MTQTIIKERPILFSTPMVRAILEGRKTQTRRIAKMPGNCHKVHSVGYSSFTPDGHISIRGEFAEPDSAIRFGEWFVKIPYGNPGDRLWVREAFGWNPDYDEGIMPCYKADKGHEYDGIKWRPSIHMPRRICRILLEIINIRVERVQGISDKDAYDEGCEWAGHGDITPAQEFKALWESIHGAESWNENPFVWAIEFKRIDQ